MSNAVSMLPQLRPFPIPGHQSQSSRPISMTRHQSLPFSEYQSTLRPKDAMCGVFVALLTRFFSKISRSRCQQHRSTSRLTSPITSIASQHSWWSTQSGRRAPDGACGPIACHHYRSAACLTDPVSEGACDSEGEESCSSNKD